MKTRSNQGGMSAIGWLVVLAIIGFTVLLVMRLAPIYLNNYKVKGSLESLHQEPYIARKSKHEILSLVERRFDINDVRNLTKRDVKVSEQQRGRVEVRVKYEVRTNILGNIDAVVMFDDAVELIAQ